MDGTVAILAGALGDRYITRDYLNPYVQVKRNEIPSSEIKLGLVAKEANQARVLGAVLCEIVSPDRLEQSLHEFSDQVPHPVMYRLCELRTALLRFGRSRQ